MYKPPRTEVEYESGDKGIAKVTFSFSGKGVQVHFKGKKPHRVKRSDCPETIRKGIWMVEMKDTDNDSIYSFRPVAGGFEGHVIRLASKKGEKPAPKTKNKISKEGKPYQYINFTAIIEITDDLKGAKGMEVPYTLRYNHFRKCEDDGKDVVGLPEYGSGKHVDALSDFLDITGIWEGGMMPWKSNILPMLEKRLLRADVTFGFSMGDGWVNGLFELGTPNADDTSWDEE